VCLEADPRDCHRSRLAMAIAAITDLPRHDLGACPCHAATSAN
jgi:hypothetical protein